METFERFSISLNQMQSLTAEALKLGADWCDLYFEDTNIADFLLRDSLLCSAAYHTDYGCGIRVIKGERTGYAYSESTDYPSLLSATKAAASIAQICGSEAKGFELCKEKVTEPRYNCLKDWQETQTSVFASFLKEIDTQIRSRDNRAVKVIVSLTWAVRHILMYNSNQELCEDCRPLGSVSVQTIFRQGDKTESNSVSRSLRKGAEMIDEKLIKDLVEKSLEGIDERFEARRPKGGQMAVVLGAGASGILLHEAMGHAFEADFNRKGQSIFSDKMGQQICPKGINIVDDGTNPYLRGSLNYDDEGVITQKTYMVSDGKLNSFLHDRISARYFGVKPTGNGRRESFRFNPIPRMRNTYMESGNDGRVEDLIAEVKKGIYVDQFANGEVKIGEGDFTFYVKRGYLIEKGKLTMPIKDVNIIGNGPQALADIQAVASDLIIDESTWTCGKEQNVSVSCGMPSVLVKKLTVGGGE